MSKFVTYYMKTGMSYIVEINKEFDGLTDEQYDRLPEDQYFIETNMGLAECTKDKQILDNKEGIEILTLR